MHRTISAFLSAVTVMVAAFGLSGCGSGDSPAPSPSPASTPPASAAPAPPPTAPLPPPSALTDVLYRLADVNVPGADKVNLVEQASADDAAALDRFGRALADNGYVPMTFDATDLAWSESNPGNVVATVIARTPPGRQGGDFSFPMEFTPADGGWQLTRGTADLLLELGAAGTPTPTR